MSLTRTLAMALIVLIASGGKGSAQEWNLGRLSRSEPLSADVESIELVVSTLADAVQVPFTSSTESGGRAGAALALGGQLTFVPESGTCESREVCPWSRLASDVPAVLGSIHASFRKGLGTGFELGAGMSVLTATPMFGTHLDLSFLPFERLTSGAFRFLPSIAIRLGVDVAFGHPQFRVVRPSIELDVAKPFQLGTVRIEPALRLRGAWQIASLDMLDLTPEIDAWQACAYDGVTCQGDASDLNQFAARRVSHRFRPMLSIGVSARWRQLGLSLGVAFPLLSDAELGGSLTSRPITADLQVQFSFE